MSAYLVSGDDAALSHRQIMPSIELFEADPTKELFEWYSKYAPNLPTRKDFDIIKYWELAPYLYLIEVVDEDHFAYRLNGEQVIEILGHSQKGRYIKSVDEITENDTFRDHLKNVIKMGQAVRCQGTLPLLHHSSISFESFDCPLVDCNGDITHILGAICLIK